MATSLIRESPVLSWPADRVTRLTLTVTLPSGRVFADWASFLLTIREDPEWNPTYGERRGDKKAAAAWADPIADGWALPDGWAAATGSVASSSTLLFLFTVPSGAGYRRYSLDVWALDGTADDVPLFPSTWLTVTARTR